MEYLIIDGYNIINAWDDIFDLKKDTLEDCRNKLFNILSNFQGFKKISAIIVFDAHLVKGSREKLDSYDNLTIVFTKENETADNYIERFVHIHGQEDQIRVVTSDYLEQTTVLNNGGIRVSPRELREEIELSNKSIKHNTAINNKKKTNTIMSNIKPELLEKLEQIRRGEF